MTLIEDRPKLAPPALRLATDDGVMVESRPRPVRSLSDVEGEVQLMAGLEDLRRQLDVASDLRYEVSMLIARFEQRMARREAV